MSLDWDIRDVKDREIHFPPNTEHVELLGHMNQKVQHAIFSTMAVQIGTITADNADEWYARYRLWNRVTGFTDILTHEDVEHLVGLSTNVFPDEPLAKWLERVIWTQHKQSITLEESK